MVIGGPRRTHRDDDVELPGIGILGRHARIVETVLGHDQVLDDLVPALLQPLADEAGRRDVVVLDEQCAQVRTSLV